MESQALFGRYNIKNVIGRGGMGTVFLAFDKQTNKNVAIKKVDLQKRSRKAVLNEPTILKNVNHKNIIQIYDIYESSQSIFMVMDYIEGYSLRDGLAEHKKFNEKLVINWASQLCEALEYLHNLEPCPIIYRDIKPSNILVDKNNKVTLIDFGIACEYRPENMDTEKVALTRGFCSPEQLADRIFDNRSDIYSLGVTMYYLISGVSPTEDSFKLRPIRDVCPEISPELEYIITKATMIDTNERYQCVEDLRYDFINIDRIKRQLRYFVFKQIATYVFFALAYLFFVSMIIIGGLRIKSDAVLFGETLVHEAQLNIAGKNYLEAYRGFNGAIEINNLSIEAYEGIYKYFYETANFIDGINYIRLRLALFENHPDLAELSNLYLGKFYIKEGNCREALKYLQTAYEIDSQNDDILVNLTLAHLKNDALSSANVFFQTLIDKDYDKYQLSYLYGIYSEEILEKPNDAIDYYGNVINNSADNALKAEAYISTAQIYKKNLDIWSNGQELYLTTLEEAISFFGESYKSFEIFKLIASEYKEKANTATGQEKIECLQKALDNYYKLFDLKEDELNLYIDVAYIYQEMARSKDNIADYNLAIQILLDATQKYPQSFLAHYHLTVMAFEQEFFKEDVGARDFRVANDYFYKAKTLVKTETDAQWIVGLDNHIKNTLGTQ